MLVFLIPNELAQVMMVLHVLVSSESLVELVQPRNLPDPDSASIRFHSLHNIFTAIRAYFVIGRPNTDVFRSASRKRTNRMKI